MDGMKFIGWLTLMISDKLDNIDVISRIEMDKSQSQFESTFPRVNVNEKVSQALMNF